MWAARGEKPFGKVVLMTEKRIIRGVGRPDQVRQWFNGSW
jgi:hypothetical protein